VIFVLFVDNFFQVESTMLIDSHCHLDAAEFGGRQDELLCSARAAGVTRIVVPSVDAASFSAVRELCIKSPACAPAYGIHPMFTDDATEDDLTTLRCYLRDHQPVALGEIGLDFFVEHYDQARQEYFFVEQLKLAREYELPVLLHTRRALDTVLKHLRQNKVRSGPASTGSGQASTELRTGPASTRLRTGPSTRLRTGIAHAFSGSRQQADELIKLGFKLGFGGAMTYDRATRIRELAATLPLESIVLETDAPDMAPAFVERGQPNKPEYLPRIAQTLAELRGISLDEVARITTQNVLSALPLLDRTA